MTWNPHELLILAAADALVDHEAEMRFRQNERVRKWKKKHPDAVHASIRRCQQRIRERKAS